MRQRISILMVVGLFFGVQGMAQRDSLAYRLTPFVKGGLSIGFFDNSISQESSVGHTGFHIDIGLVRVPPTRFNGDNKSSNVAVSLGIGYLF